MTSHDFSSARAKSNTSQSGRKTGLVSYLYCFALRHQRFFVSPAHPRKCLRKLLEESVNRTPAGRARRDLAGHTDTFAETNIAPENGWLEDAFLCRVASLQVRTVSFRECNWRATKGLTSFAMKSTHLIGWVNCFLLVVTSPSIG